MANETKIKIKCKQCGRTAMVKPKHAKCTVFCNCEAGVDPAKKEDFHADG